MGSCEKQKELCTCRPALGAYETAVEPPSILAGSGVNCGLENSSQFCIPKLMITIFLIPARMENGTANLNLSQFIGWPCLLTEFYAIPGADALKSFRIY